MLSDDEQKKIKEEINMTPQAAEEIMLNAIKEVNKKVIAEAEENGIEKGMKKGMKKRNEKRNEKRNGKRNGKRQRRRNRRNSKKSQRNTASRGNIKTHRIKH